ncbi:MAG: hypothetical protein JNM76_06445 [Betaproteobacteria bacterium]|nr:hypothetical protein [Betaproteobacteria bacterium]
MKAVILTFGAMFFLSGIGAIGGAIISDDPMFFRVVQSIFGLPFALVGGGLLCYAIGWLPESWLSRLPAGSATQASDPQSDHRDAYIRMRINESNNTHAPAPACDPSPPTFSGADSCSVGPSSPSNDT